MVIINEEFKKRVNNWKDSGKRRSYFSKYYFNDLKYFRGYLRLKNARIKKEEDNEYKYKCCLEDGFTMEETIKVYYRLKLEKIRLANKLKELNINSWEITTTSFFNYSSRNKEGNFIKAFYKGNEILF
jgi:hypothetical protein